MRSTLQLVLPEPPAHALDRRPTTGSSLVCPGLEAEMTVSDPTAWGASGPHAPALGAATQPRAVPPCKQWCCLLPQPHGWPDSSRWHFFEEKRKRFN